MFCVIQPEPATSKGSRRASVTQVFHELPDLTWRDSNENLLKPRISTFFHDQPPPRPSTNSLTPVRWDSLLSNTEVVNIKIDRKGRH